MKKFSKSVKKGESQTIKKTQELLENSLICGSKQMLSESDTECRGCKKGFNRLLGHISRNKICKSFYTDAEIMEKQKEKRGFKNRSCDRANLKMKELS